MGQEGTRIIENRSNIMDSHCNVGRVGRVAPEAFYIRGMQRICMVMEKGWARWAGPPRNIEQAMSSKDLHCFWFSRKDEVMRKEQTYR